MSFTGTLSSGKLSCIWKFLNPRGARSIYIMTQSDRILSPTSLASQDGLQATASLAATKPHTNEGPMLTPEPGLTRPITDAVETPVA